MRQPVAVIHLTDEEAKTLEEWTRRGQQENRLVERARIILLAHAGRTNQQIAEALVSIARSKPTAFQAVSFEPPDPRENRRDGGISAKCARGL